MKGREVSAAGGGGGGRFGAPEGATVGGVSFFGCTGPLQPERCAWVGIGGRGAHPLVTAGHTINISLPKQFVNRILGDE